MEKITVVGLGNILFVDEGFGVEAVRTLEASGDWPESAQFVDGGTQGLYLLDYFESCDALMVFDSMIPVEYEPEGLLLSQRRTSGVYPSENVVVPDGLQ